VGQTGWSGHGGEEKSSAPTGNRTQTVILLAKLSQFTLNDEQMK